MGLSQIIGPGGTQEIYRDYEGIYAGHFGDCIGIVLRKSHITLYNCIGSLPGIASTHHLKLCNFEHLMRGEIPYQVCGLSTGTVPDTFDYSLSL